MAASTPARAQSDDSVAIYAPVRPLTTLYHGVRVTESYRWLEDGADPLVQTWTESETSARATIWTPCPAARRSSAISPD